MRAHAQAASQTMDRNSLRREKSIWVNDAAWLLALSPDGKSIGIVGFQSGKVYTIDIASGFPTEIMMPDMTAMKTLAWTNDSMKLAICNGRILAIADTKRAIITQQLDILKIERPPQSGFGQAAIFSPDNTKLYVQNGNGQSGHLILTYDLAKETVTSFMPTPNPLRRISHFQGGQFQHLSHGDVLSTVIGFREEKKFQDLYCFIVPLSEEQNAPAPIHVIMDYEHGIDGSGVMRQFIDKCLFSEPANLTVAFCASGTQLPNIPLDVSKDKAFQAFDGAGRRVSTFGGYGALEGNSIGDFDIHPTEPWAVTTAMEVTLANGRTVGMVTVWDLLTGAPLQRIETATGICKPIISRDGSLMTAAAADGINIFHFN